MNRHFEDAQYYLKRAVETASKGVKAELEPVIERVRELTGREVEPDPTRVDQAKARLREARLKAEREARETVDDAREKVGAYRRKQSA